MILLVGGLVTMCSSLGSDGEQAGKSGVAESHEAGRPHLGQAVQHGNFTFVVRDISTDTTGTQADRPRGEFIVVTVSVTNNATEPQSFSPGDQMLLDSSGRTYAADSMAALRMNNDSMVSDLDPGSTISVKLPFDVPAGTEPSAVQLLDSAYSGGVKVPLS